MKLEIQLMEALMTLNDFTIQKTITENNIGRISEGIITKTHEGVLLITHFKNTTVRLATRHAMRDHLHHIIDQFQQNDRHYFVIKKHDGIPLKQYLLKPNYDLDSRIYICYELLKVVRKYDAFPDTIKYQLFQLPQWEMVEDVLMLKEAILFDEQTPFSFNDVLKQIAYLMELIIQPTSEPHIQFIENLVLGNHHYTQLDTLISDYKAIFIYEKPEIIAAIPREFNLIFSENTPSDETFSHEPQPERHITPQNDTPSFFEPDSDASEKKPLHVSRKRNLSDDLFLEENETYLSELFGPEVDLPTKHKTTSPVKDIDIDTPTGLSLSENIKTLESKLSKATVEVINLEPLSIPYVPEELPPFCDFTPSDDPFSQSTTDEPALFDTQHTDMQRVNMQDDTADLISNALNETNTKADTRDEVDADTADKPDKVNVDENVIHNKSFSTTQSALEKPAYLLNQNKTVLKPEDNADAPISSAMSKSVGRDAKYYIFPIIATLTVLMLIVLGSKILFFKSDILEASYQIEALADDRVAFINTSTSSTRIDVSEWTIYYDNRLIQQFVTDNLYPIFETEGEYTVELRIKDSEGNWSAVYRQVFPYYEESANEGASLEINREESTIN